MRRSNRPRALTALLLGLVGAGCDGAQKICNSVDDCAAREVCLPAGFGDDAPSYCGQLDDDCPTGLRWSDSAGHGLGKKCVSFADLRDGGSTDAPARFDAGDAGDARDAAQEAPPACTEGAVCMPTTDPCKQPGRCSGGVCGAITDAPDGTVCGTASNACRTDPVCKKGVCQAEGTRADGYNYDSSKYLARCCGGTPTSINSPNDCGACGIRCASGRCINTGSKNEQQWWCACSASSECWSGCCADGSPPVCSPSSCGSPAKCLTCPGGASCTQEQNPHYWCHY